METTVNHTHDEDTAAVESEKILIKVPKRFTFAHNGVYDFHRPLNAFDWSPFELGGRKVDIDLRGCQNANYQALSLFVLYGWEMANRGGNIEFWIEQTQRGASAMWSRMGARTLFDVLNDNNSNFQGSPYKPLFAVRNQSDFRAVLKKSQTYTEGFDIEYEKTLRYVLSELLYNTLEHGKNVSVPSLAQFAWYREKQELSFIVADLGIGIKTHLRKVYPELADDASAIEHALRPQVSGTFTRSQPYAAKNNAGVGLYISSNIIKRLHADMHIISGHGVVHISPKDVTKRTIGSFWPGTLVYITVKLSTTQSINLQRMMSEFRSAAATEISEASQREQNQMFYLSVWNYFGKYAEDKARAIRIRDKDVVPAVNMGKDITLDFDKVIAAPHSFLSCILNLLV